MRLIACLLACALGAGIAACGDGSTGDGRPDQPGAAAAIAAAEAYATNHGTEPGPGTQFLQSTRDPTWALVSGSRAARGVWAVWLRADGNHWRPEHAVFDGRGDTTPGRVPCDIKPPFSEPECPPR